MRIGTERVAQDVIPPTPELAMPLWEARLGTSQSCLQRPQPRRACECQVNEMAQHVSRCVSLFTSWSSTCVFLKQGIWRHGLRSTGIKADRTVPSGWRGLQKRGVRLSRFFSFEPRKGGHRCDISSRGRDWPKQGINLTLPEARKHARITDFCSTPQKTLAPRKTLDQIPFFHPEEGGIVTFFFALVCGYLRSFCTWIFARSF